MEDNGTMKYIDAYRLRAELEKRLKNLRDYMHSAGMKYKGPKYYKAQGKESSYDALLNIIDSLQQEQPKVDIVNTDNRIQYASIKSGIKAHAETYSFNIESQLYPKLTKEQQAIWRKEIEQACISGGEAGVELAKDMRYKENQQPEVDLEEEITRTYHDGSVADTDDMDHTTYENIALHFYELGLNARKEK